MNTQELIELKLKPALRECELHRARLHAAWVEASTYAELQPEVTTDLSEAQVRTLDQLVFRFGRLQDTIGMRLLPALLRLMQEWDEGQPFLDKLNRAEKIGLLASASQWAYLRELRNQSAHEYPDQPQRLRQQLCRMVAEVPALEAALLRLTTAAHARLASLSDPQNPPQT